MATLITEGDRLLSVTGRRSWLKKGSVPLSNYAGGGAVRLLGDGTTISYAQLYRRQPWIAIAVNKLARQIARLPLKVFEEDSQGDRARVREHPLVDLLHKPWPRGDANKLKQAIAFPTLLHGNSVNATRRKSKGAPPSTFFPLDWRFLTPIYDEGGPIMVWESTQPDAPQFTAPEDVVHTAWDAPDGPLGVSPLEQLGITIRLEDAAQRYSSSSFNNAARPSGALVAPADRKMDREERQELRDEVKAAHGGIDKAFNLMLLTGGLEWKAFSHTAKEAELIEQRKLNREEVAAVYDIPPPLIGILDHATYSNVSEMHRMLYMTVLGPWLDLIEQTLQGQLIDPEPAFEGLFVEFDLAEVLKGDTRTRILALKDGIQTGLYTLNEARKIENLPRIDHPLANQPLIPQNNLGPLGAKPEESADAVAPMLASHVARARERVLSKAAAGAEDPLDAQRFERELAEDLKPHLNGGAERFAALWAKALAEGVEAADGDLDELKSFFSALT